MVALLPEPEDGIADLFRAVTAFLQEGAWSWAKKREGQTDLFVPKAGDGLELNFEGMLLPDDFSKNKTRQKNGGLSILFCRIA